MRGTDTDMASRTLAAHVPTDPASAVATHIDAEDEDEAWGLLARWVGIPSVTGATRAIAADVLAWAKSRGLHHGLTPTGAPWMSTSPDPFGPDMPASHWLLFGHLDTVPGDIEVGLVADRERGDERLAGRGAVDAKGCMAVFASVLAKASGDASVRARGLTVIGAVDEEGDSATAAWLVSKAGMRVPPAVVVIGEPSGSDTVTIGYKGRLGVTVELAVPRAHGGAPVPSAGDLMVTMLGSLPRLWSQVCPADDAGSALFPCLTSKVLSLATSSDGLMDHVAADLDIRVPPGLDPDVVGDELQAHLAGLLRAALDPGLEPSSVRVIVHEGAVRAHVASPKSGLVRAFRAAQRSRWAGSAGFRPRVVHKTGTSDACILGPAWPAADWLAYGPGDSRLDHAPDEHIWRSEFVHALHVFDDVVSGPADP